MEDGWNDTDRREWRMDGMILTGGVEDGWNDNDGGSGGWME